MAWSSPPSTAPSCSTRRRCAASWCASAAPERRLSQLSPLAASERQQLLAEWGEGDVDPVQADGDPQLQQLHRLFAAQVERGPRRVALVYGQERITYRELQRRAGALARRLRAAGVGPERTVGLLMERRPALIVAILAVLEAGGAYLPLAADLPADRLGFVLADAGVHLVLADAALAPRLAAAGPPVLDPDADEPAGDAAGPRDGTEAANLCYVIYTSGSTGRPKGVMVPHGAVSATLRWRLQRFRLSPADCEIGRAHV